MSKKLDKNEITVAENENTQTEATNETIASEGDFKSFNLKSKVLSGIKAMGFSVPSPVQKEAIPAVLEGNDLIVQAQTGTGKTAAFAIPILNSLKLDGTIEALVITPTRELAMQISDEVFNLGKGLYVKTMCAYGGQNARKQLELLNKKPSVLIATPGRLLDYLKNDKLTNFCPKMVVLDESDEMLDMGFLEDIEKILSYLPTNVQTLLFSATMPAPIKSLANKILVNPKQIKITPNTITNNNIEQLYFIVDESSRNDAIKRLLEDLAPTKSIIFTRTKREADMLSDILKASKQKIVTLHGDMDQRQRRDAITAFKAGNKIALVATDVAARGLDISDISHVFNYHIPLSSESYVHRIGRTGRAGKKGIAITLVSPLEFKDLKKIQHDIQATLSLYKPDITSINKNIAKDIAEATISDAAISIYEEIKFDIQETQLILKLLSLYMKKYEIKEFDINSEEKPSRNSNRNDRGGNRNFQNRGGRNDRSVSRGGNFKKDDRKEGRSDRRPSSNRRNDRSFSDRGGNSGKRSPKY